MLFLMLLIIVAIVGFKFLFTYFDNRMSAEWAFSYSAFICLLVLILVIRMATSLNSGIILLFMSV